MFHNYYFLKPLSQAIAQQLQVNWQLGYEEVEFRAFRGEAMRLVTCFSQNKDELVLGFCNSQTDFYIRATLNNELSSLSFPDDYARAKKNSINLFKELLDLEIIGLTQYLNERSFSLHFAQDYTLLFKMHGKRSNIILFEKEEFVIAFHKKMENDYSLVLAELDKDLDQSWQNFENNHYDFKALFPTFGKEIKDYLNQKNYAQLSPVAQWQALSEVQTTLQNAHFWVLTGDNEPQLTLLPPEASATIRCATLDPIEAANEYFFALSRLNFLEKERQDALKEIQKRHKQSQAYIDKNFARLAELSDGSENEKIANLIMANLHQIPSGAATAEVLDFYTDETRIIKLKKELSPQKNAESYYRKAKNEKIEQETLQRNMERKESEIEELKKHQSQIELFDSLKELRKYLKDNKLAKIEKNNNPDQHLFKKFSFQNFEIWIGKNAKNNDLLTQQYAYKEDLWLHAKDVSGSHVIIKYQAGKPFPKSVIEKAAALAAYYSKGSHDTLCPVIYTPKKYVRKTKDLAPGQVIVEKEEVMMVVPEKF
ncbi:MAG: NFACT RNA binding domain-containing protein [Microscillaceae bacterium]|jgi:predicted ribosome quality control (RQC) complex YloA/Tae2 family protein|nr:NFACT RNA binding domain-containing protein [Microscillaceae bacterium]